MAFVYWIHLPEHTAPKTQGYIGITSKTVEARFNQHKFDIKRSKLRLHNNMNKYKDSIVVDTLLEDDLEFCQLVEWGYRDSTNIGWNHGVGGVAPRLGSKASVETRNKLSIAQMGRKPSEETRNKMSAWQLGKVLSESTKLKISKANKGAQVSEETRRKLSIAGKGRKISNETRAKLRPYWENKVFCKKAKEQALIYNLSLKSWNNNSSKANSKTWLLSEDMYSYTQTNPSHGSKRLAKAFNLKESNVIGVLKKLRSNWNPYEDLEYQSWKQQTLKEAECQQTNYSD